MDAVRYKRMKRREFSHGVRFVTFSCEHRLPLLGRAEIRDVFVQRLDATRARFGIELYAWVVMPEHVHLLLRSTSDHPVSRVLDYLKRSVAGRVIERWRQIHASILCRIARGDVTFRFWQKGGGFDRNVRNEDEFEREVRYVHQNPVERELVRHPRDWRWSSARWWLDETDGVIPCDPAVWIPAECRRKLV